MKMSLGWQKCGKFVTKSCSVCPALQHWVSNWKVAGSNTRGEKSVDVPLNKPLNPNNTFHRTYLVYVTIKHIFWFSLPEPWSEWCAQTPQETASHWSVYQWRILGRQDGRHWHGLLCSIHSGHRQMLLWHHPETIHGNTVNKGCIRDRRVVQHDTCNLELCEFCKLCKFCMKNISC